jgi:hypothetical protein
MVKVFNFVGKSSNFSPVKQIIARFWMVVSIFITFAQNSPYELRELPLHLGASIGAI